MALRTTMAIIALACGRAAADERGTIYDLTTRARECSVSKVTPADQPPQMNCRFRFSDLDFEINGVGGRDTVVSFLESGGYDGHFYATYGVAHGCVTVKAGKKERKRLAVADDLAFISPQSGKVYRDEESCQMGR